MDLRGRLGLRTILATAAVVAIALAAALLWQRSREFDRLADVHEAEEKKWRRIENFQLREADLVVEEVRKDRENPEEGTAPPGLEKRGRGPDPRDVRAGEAKDHADRHSRLKAMYRALAGKPWSRPEVPAGG